MQGFTSACRVGTAIALFLSLVVGPAVSQAAFSVPHGTFVGDTVTYEDVLETSSTNSALFGAPTLPEDDTLVFLPTVFSLSSPTAGVTAIIDSQIRFTMTAKPGETIPLLFLEEFGSVTLTGGAQGDFVSAMVGMPVFYHILEINGVASNGPSGHVNMTFNPSGGAFTLANGNLSNVAWAGTALLDFDQIILNDPLFAGSATKIEITFDNALATAALGSSFASIAKNKLRISVPELSSPLLFAFALGMVAIGTGWKRFRRAPAA